MQFASKECKSLKENYCDNNSFILHLHAYYITRDTQIHDNVICVCTTIFRFENGSPKRLKRDFLKRKETCI